MNKLLLFCCCAITAMACRYRAQPGNHPPTADTAKIVADTAINPCNDQVRIADSLETQHARDSLFAIKPVKVFTTDKKGDAFDKMAAGIIDTTGVIKRPLVFHDTSLVTYDTNQEPVSERRILRSKEVTVEVYVENVMDYSPRRLFINGREMKAGRDLDTSVSGSYYTECIDIVPEACSTIQYGSKQYLLLTGDIDHCNGMGCGVAFYILYDAAIKKGMVLQQYHSDFTTGYNREQNTPVFIDMQESMSDNYLFNCFMCSGKVYSFNHAGKIRPVVSRNGKQLYFSGYSKDGGDTICLTGLNAP